MSQSDELDKIPLNFFTTAPAEFEASLPGRDPTLAFKLAEAQAKLTASLGVPLASPSEGDRSTPNSLSYRLLKHSSKLAVGTLLASTLLLSACGDNGPDRCETRMVTPTAAPGDFGSPAQTPTAVQYCQDNNGSHYYTGGYYGGSHYYGGSYYGGSGSSSSGGSSSS